MVKAREGGREGDARFRVASHDAKAPRCQTCRFWNNVENGKTYSQGICERLSTDPASPGANGERRMEILWVPVRAESGKLAEADLMTPHYFGCVLHTPEAANG